MDETQVKVTINGKEAEDELNRLRKDADAFKKSMLEAYKAGNNEAARAFNKELKQTEQQIRRNESGVKAVTRVMNQLNRATPSELNKALKHLQSELKTIERGTPAWDSHVQKIRLVKAEIDKVNAEMRQSESLLVRMKNKVNDWGTVAMGAVGAVTGLVLAGKKAVNTYASMQQEEANVRKYTGMTAEEVDRLNEAFKKMDTRTSREELNKLAQEAGRLGMQSEEDVLGFVRAADKINVALDDLGDGATLTLSKLTDIFGDKLRLGTEKSLLAVGSVINELSQNCTASAPYLAEFAQRLAGVGAQAHMTIPEIMGFGAVLDSQGQKLEMSATALSKVIMNLFKNPEKIAKATGMSIEQFSETCKRSTNEGLMMLLDRLHELGGIDSLAPVFADMGENGARASAVLAALAGNVDMVRQQQEAANVAFQEAISIDKEFEVQNTTVQAGLEKARKGFTEMAVTLGKELMPVVSHILSGTSATMRIMLKTIQFVKEHRVAMVSLAAAVTAYTVAVNLALIKEKIHAAVVAVKTAAMHVHKVAVLAASAAYNALTGNTVRANAAMKLLNKTMLLNPWAAVIAAVAAAVVALGGYILKSRSAARAADEQRKALQRQREAEKAVAGATGEVVGKYEMLRKEWQKLSTAQEKKEWLEKNRDAFEQLGLNINNAVDADEAFVKSSDKVIEALKARAKAEALQDLYKQRMQSAYEKAVEEGSNDIVVDTTSAVNAKDRAAAGVTREEERWSSYTDQFGTHELYQGLTDAGAAKVNEYYRKKAEEDVARLTKEYTEEVENVYGSMFASAQKEAEKAENNAGGLIGKNAKLVKVGGGSGGNGGNGNGSGNSQEEHNAALKELDDWKKKEQAIEDIAYALGEKSHSAHTARNKEIEKEYHERRLALLEKGTAEYYQEQASYEKKLRSDNYAASLKEQQSFFEEEKRCLDERYMNNELTHKQYTRALEEAELDHLDNIVRLYKNGSEEYIKAQEDLRKKEHEIQKKRADEYKKIQDEIRKAYFSTASGASDKEAYEEEIMQLEAVKSQLLLVAETEKQKNDIFTAYREARFQIAKKYNMEEAMDEENAFRSAIEKMAQWLKSDYGQAFMQSFSTMVNGMGEIFSGLSSLIDAETDIQTANINKKYEEEIAAAGNNSEKVSQLEKEKEEKIAQVKNEAEEKKYGMQVAQAIAQTAISALNAYSSAAAIPVVGWIMAPIAAAMAVVAGGIQIAALKKQRDAALAQGYAAGGYTMPGKKHQPAGIVHAGEWVASQELLANPTAAATIAQLDYAQRTNTIGQLRPARTVNAAQEEVIAPERRATYTRNGESADISESINRLNRTLDNGIYAATLVTGDKGILRQQRKYEQLMRNKSGR